MDSGRSVGGRGSVMGGVVGSDGFPSVEALAFICAVLLPDPSFFFACLRFGYTSGFAPMVEGDRSNLLLDTSVLNVLAASGHRRVKARGRSVDSVLRCSRVTTPFL